MSNKDKPNLIRASTFILNDQRFHTNCNFYAIRRHHTEPQQQCSCSQVFFFKIN